MNILRKSIILGIAAFSIGSAALAAPGEPAGQHSYAATKFDPAKRAERFNQRQQTLHDALKLNAHQEVAWQTYLGAITPKQPAGRPERIAFKEMTAPQRMEKRLELSRNRLQQQESRLAALKTFYGVLTPEQQETFDTQTAGRTGHGGKHRRG